LLRPETAAQDKQGRPGGVGAARRAKELLGRPGE